MDSFVEKLLADSPEGMKGEAKTPAANFLSGVNPDAEKLDKECAQMFHTLTAKLLFLCKRRALLHRRWCPSSRLARHHKTSTTGRSYRA